jgi:hypothetical protein
MKDEVTVRLEDVEYLEECGGGEDQCSAVQYHAT